MTRFALALLAASALSSPACAADDPASIKGANDTRIRTVDYSEKVVTRITSTNKVPVVLTYDDAEIPKLISGLKVADVTIKEGADAKATAAAADACTEWCADRHANELTLQPLKDDPGSMLAVTTEKTNPDGSSVRRHYAYELRTRTGQITDPPDKEAYFRIGYTYSAQAAARQAAAWREAHKDDIAAAQKQKVQDQLALAQFGGNRNYQWTHGDSPDCRALSPQRISDNGQFTVLYFPMNTPVSIPNAVATDPSKAESRLEWHPEKTPDSGDLMVLHSVPKQFVLRRDKMVCLFVRDPHAPWQPVPSTGTSSPDVIRETRK